MSSLLVPEDPPESMGSDALDADLHFDVEGDRDDLLREAIASKGDPIDVMMSPVRPTYRALDGTGRSVATRG